MGVKVKFYRGAWWVFIDHLGRRRSKKVGDQQAAQRIAKELRERLGRGDLHLAAGDVPRSRFTDTAMIGWCRRD